MKLLMPLLLLAPCLSFSQSNNIQISKLDVFVNSAEKELFSRIEAGEKPDYFHLLLTSDNLSDKKVSKDDCKQRIEKFLSEKQVNGKNDAHSAKALKKLYKTIHDAFLVKYTDNPGFSEMFVNGNYNCATASALYAYLLNAMQIDYNIRETPDHVYIIAAPSTHNIVFETTAPGARVLQFNDKMKSQYLEYLYKNKLISKTEWESGDKNELFNKHFYADKVIDFRQLIGLLYYNRGLAAMQDENLEESYKNFEKSYFLYPAEKAKYFASASLLGFIAKSEKKDEDDKFHQYIVRYEELGDKEVASEVITNYLKVAAKKRLLESQDTAKYFNIYNSLVRTIKNDELSRELRKDHYYNVAYYYYLKSKYNSSKVYLDSLYAINKDNLLVQQMYTDIIIRMIQAMPETRKAADTISAYFKQYPFLVSHQPLIEYQVYCLAKESAMSWEKNEDFKTAMKYMWQMDEILKAHPEVAMKHEMYVVPVYTALSSYFVRKEDYKTARTILKAVEKHLPANEEVIRRLKHVEKRLAEK